jgi:hypothetical protein
MCDPCNLFPLERHPPQLRKRIQLLCIRDENWLLQQVKFSNRLLAAHPSPEMRTTVLQLTLLRAPQRPPLPNASRDAARPLSTHFFITSITSTATLSVQVTQDTVKVSSTNFHSTEFAEMPQQRKLAPSYCLPSLAKSQVALSKGYRQLKNTNGF